MTIESKIDATERLRREGRWSEASAWRDEQRRRLKGEGMKRAEANEESWRLMLAEYPPLAESADSAGELGVDESEIDALIDATREAPRDLVRDTLWAYDNLSNRRVAPKDAPSAGAWNILAWAKSNKNRFFEQMLPKAMAASVEAPEAKSAAEKQDDCEEMFELFKKDLGEEEFNRRLEIIATRMFEAAI